MSGLAFLINSGADVSVFPISLVGFPGRPAAGSGTLVAANGLAIRTFGSRTLFLRFRTLHVNHSFLLAEVPRPILGSYFFSAHGLLIDLKNRQLVRLPCPDASFAVLPAVVDAGPHSVAGMHAPRSNACLLYTSDAADE